MTTPAPLPDPSAHPAGPPVRVRRATPADRPVLERLWPLFRHDMSAVSGELPGPDGTFRDERLRAALDEIDGIDGIEHDAQGDEDGRGRRPAVWRGYLATVDGDATGAGGRTGERPVAFALVRGLDAPTRVLSAFFVVRAARQQGVGRDVAAAVLRDVPGPWEIAFQDANAAAAAFWPRVATDVAGDAWSVTHRAVPGRPDVPPDAWLSLSVGRAVG
ncbi:GNAT family N-acetyltransferase [Isoptericola sp. NPDC056578]|uniref:GNAT family N-acetyltransferase n=1 Tax=Isoptericola sp. NPDC056578 TaxID=3345870 RepID=UPI0036A9646E